MKLIPIPVVQERAQRAKHVSWTPEKSHNIYHLRLSHNAVAQVLQWYSVLVATV